MTSLLVRPRQRPRQCDRAFTGQGSSHRLASRRRRSRQDRSARILNVGSLRFAESIQGGLELPPEQRVATSVGVQGSPQLQKVSPACGIVNQFVVVEVLVRDDVAHAT